MLAHGWVVTHRHWDDVVELLRAARPDVRVVRWDQRGHGRSTGGRAGTAASMDQLASDLQRVLRVVVPHGPFVLAGHSMGGMGVMAWARLHGDDADRRVRGTLLVSTAMGGLAPRRPGRVVPGAMRLMSRAPRRAVLPRMPPRLARRRAWGPSTPDAVIRRSAGRDGWVRTAALGGWYPALMAHDEREGLRRLGRSPVHVMVGEHDRLTPVRLSREIAAELPQATYEELSGYGHMLAIEHPEAVVRHLVELLGH